MRARDNVDIGLQSLEKEKDQLIQKLNDALMRLDTLNQSKREISSKLLEQIQFVRDLQKATGEAGMDDLNSIVSDQYKNEYNREKELHKQLEE